MAADRAVGRLVLVDAVRGHQHGGHHSCGAVGGGQHVAHHVAVVVLAGPDVTAAVFDHPGYRVVDETVFIFQPGVPELFHILLHEHLLENLPEIPVVDFGNGVLGGKNQILLHIQGVGHTAAGKAADGVVQIVDALGHARGGKIVNQLPALGPVFSGKYQLAFSRAVDLHLRGPVEVAVSVAGQGDGLLPGFYIRLDALDQNRRAEHRAVQGRADGRIGALPHLFQVVLPDAL